LNFLCVPHSEDYLFLIREVHTSAYRGHFGTTKTIQHLQGQFHWPSRQPQVEKFIRACALCSQSKPSNRKHGLYQQLPLPSHPWEVMVCCFRKMALFIPCTKTTTAAKTMELYFRHVWPHFGLPSTIISDRDSLFLNTFLKTI